MLNKIITIIVLIGAVLFLTGCTEAIKGKRVITQPTIDPIKEEQKGLLEGKITREIKDLENTLRSKHNSDQMENYYVSKDILERCLERKMILVNTNTKEDAINAVDNSGCLEQAGITGALKQQVLSTASQKMEENEEVMFGEKSGSKVTGYAVLGLFVFLVVAAMVAVLIYCCPDGSTVPSGCDC